MSWTGLLTVQSYLRINGTFAYANFVKPSAAKEKLSLNDGTWYIEYNGTNISDIDEMRLIFRPLLITFDRPDPMFSYVTLRHWQ